MPDEKPASSIQDVVMAALAQTGLSISSDMIRTILLFDGRFLGEKYRFDGGVAVWLAREKVVEIYDDAGKQLASIAREQIEASQVA